MIEGFNLGNQAQRRVWWKEIFNSTAGNGILRMECRWIADELDFLSEKLPLVWILLTFSLCFALLCFGSYLARSEEISNESDIRGCFHEFIVIFRAA